LMKSAPDGDPQATDKHDQAELSVTQPRPGLVVVELLEKDEDPETTESTTLSAQIEPLAAASEGSRTRDLIADARDVIADERDEAADGRDEVADAREEAADARDLAARRPNGQ
jgi:hypothetical protein